MDAAERPSGGGRLASSFRWLMLAQVVQKAGAVVILYLLARAYSEDFFGRYAIALAIPMAFEPLADLGVSQAMVRAVAGNPSTLRAHLSAAIPAKLVSGSVSIIASYVVARMIGLDGEVVEVTLYLAIARALESLTYLARSVFQARERMAFEALSLAMDGGTRVAFVVYAIQSGFGLVGLAKALALASGVVLVATAYIAVRRFIGRLEWHLAPRRTLRLVLSGLPLAVVWLLDVLPMRLDVVLVGLFRGDAAAGGFAAAARLIEPATVIPYTIAVALLPLAARHLSEKMTTVPSLFRATVKVSLALGLLGTLLLAGGASVVIDVIFGPNFAESVIITRALALALGPLFVNTVLVAFLTALYEQRRLMVAEALGLAMNLTIATVALTQWGVAAAALAVLIGELVRVISALLLVHRLRALAVHGILKVPLAAAPAAMILLLVPVVGPVLATAGAALVYLVLLARFEAFEPAERAYVLTSLIPLSRFRSRLSSSATR